MNVPVWAAELAASFWAAVGEPEPFPRNLRNAIARTVPLTIVSLPNLRIESASRWLEKVQAPCRIESSDRPLHGMLVTFRGLGFVFLNGADGEDEQRYSLAHELSHFLRDYWRPRQRVRQQLGDAGLEILDGDRMASIEERAVAAIESLPLQCQTHLLERTPDGSPASRSIGRAERDADRLAFELLAPVFHLSGTDLERRPRGEWPDVLHNRYGFPRWAAEQYLRILSPEERSEPLLFSLTDAIRATRRES